MIIRVLHEKIMPYDTGKMLINVYILYHDSVRDFYMVYIQVSSTHLSNNVNEFTSSDGTQWAFWIVS